MTVADLKVGSKLPNGVTYGFGQYINIEVSSIEILPNNKYIIKVNKTYVGAKGIIIDTFYNVNYSCKPLLGTKEIIIPQDFTNITLNVIKKMQKL